MKVTDEHLNIMREAIEAIDCEEYREAYRTGQIPRADLVKDIDKRYRWDLYWAASRRSDKGMPDSQNGYDTNHIDTALRAIVKPL